MRFAIVASALLAAASPPALACDARLDGGQTIESPRYRIAYRPDPAKVAVGKPFALDMIICSNDAAIKIDELRVDAQMPEHRHGMNYKASVKPQGDAGRYRAEGLMFHMPGRWEFLFDVRDGRGIERLRHDHPVR